MGKPDIFPRFNYSSGCHGWGTCPKSPPAGGAKEGRPGGSTRQLITALERCYRSSSSSSSTVHPPQPDAGGMSSHHPVLRPAPPPGLAGLDSAWLHCDHKLNSPSPAALILLQPKKQAIWHILVVCARFTRLIQSPKNNLAIASLISSPHSITLRLL